MAQGMQETKRRIQSVKVISKITKAMKLVATAKLRRAKKNFDDIREYYEAVDKTVSELLINVRDVKKIFPKVAKEKTLYIAITSDLGLCGSYNSNVLKLLKHNLKADDILVMIGTKGNNHMLSLNRKPDFTFLKTGDKPSYEVSNTISREVLSQFYSGNINKVRLIYTKYVNTLTFIPTITDILPVVNKETDKDAISQNYEFEPDAETVLKKTIPLYVSSLIFGALAESQISEQSSRRTAMESATDNADELTKDLELKYNRARQGAITQEISEIIAGANSN